MLTFEKYYRPLDKSSWQGRVDHPSDRDAFRWHQVVEELNLASPALTPPVVEGRGFCFLGFCCDEGVKRNKGRAGAVKAPAFIRAEMSNLPCWFDHRSRLFDAGDILCPGGDLDGRHPASIGYEGNFTPLRVDGVSCAGTGGTLSIINPAAFTFTGYQLGNTAQQSGRGQCEGPDFFQVDLSLYKQLYFGDRFNVQLRFEFFNIFDRTNVVGQSIDRSFNPGVTLDGPRGSATTVVDTDLPAGTFGQASAVRDPFQVQLGIKFSF